MLILMLTLMVAQSDSLASPAASTQQTMGQASSNSMGRGDGASGYGGRLSGYNTKAHPAASLPPQGASFGGGVADKPLVLTPIYKPVAINHFVDRDGVQWDLVPGSAMYRNAKTGDKRYSPPAGATPLKVKPKS